MLSVFSGIVAISEAFPILDSWLQRFIAWYAENKLAGMKSENREAVIKAARTHDQRPIEEVIQSPTAGKPSGVPGAVIVPGPPKWE